MEGEPGSLTACVRQQQRAAVAGTWAGARTDTSVLLSDGAAEGVGR